MNAQHFTTESLRSLPQGAAITRVLAAAVAAVEPAAAVRRFLMREATLLHIGAQTYDLGGIARVLLVAFGKAAAPMAHAAAEVLGEYLAGGVVITKDGYFGEAPHIPITVSCYEAAHPIPDARGIAATAQVLQLLDGATEHDLVIALISGGGSALLTQPVAGITLEAIQQLTGVLLRCGASIDEINTLRKHLDAVKGGGLAGQAHPAQLAALILSDVVGSPLDSIASGPTVADRSTFADALAVLSRYAVIDDVPASVIAQLRRGAAGEIAETRKPNDLCFGRAQNLIIGSNPQAAAAALEQAKREGFVTIVLTSFLQGEAREAGRFLAAIGREIVTSGQPLTRPACIIAGGETTVTLRGAGRGGRNQELALGAVADLAGIPGMVLVALATDGGDGPTDAAGAVVTGATSQRAASLNLDVNQFLAHNDAYHFFAALDDLLKPGPTQTNVNDLAFLFAL